MEFAFSETQINFDLKAFKGDFYIYDVPIYGVYGVPLLILISCPLLLIALATALVSY